ncbi:MAG: substrate-binding domain-containing protein, partial [Sphaerochaetaceae bacterium]
MVAINDMVAYGVMDAIKDGGRAIPADYSVCGFDNIYPSSFCGVGLTSVEHFIVQGGRSAVRLVCEMMNKKPSRVFEGSGVTRVEYHNRLIVRSSTAAPKSVE